MYVCMCIYVCGCAYDVNLFVWSVRISVCVCLSVFLVVIYFLVAAGA